MPIPLFPIVFFSISLIVFHIWALCKPWKKRTWLLIEYFWLGSAVLALFGLSIEVDKILAETDLILHQSLRDARLDDVKNHASDYPLLFDKGSIFHVWTENPESGKFYIHFSQICRQIVNAADVIDIAKIKELQSELRILRQNSGDPMQFFGRMEDAVNNFLHSENRLRQTKKKMERHPLTDWFVFLSFIVLPIALALPITKVTVQLKNRLEG